MNSVNLERARQLISASAILTQPEKVEWGQLLGRMSDQQVARLITILTPHPTQRPPQPAPINLTQKDLPRGLPVYEKDLPPPRSQQQPARSPAPTSLETIKESVVAAHVETPKMQPTPPPAPAAQPQLPPVPVAKQPVVQQPEPASGKMAQPKLREYAPEVVASGLIAHLREPQDFAKLSPVDIHYTHPDKVFADVLQHIVQLSSSQQAWMIVQNLEASPLYQAYIDTGDLLLNNPTADTAKFDMSKDEFEAFADFRKNLYAIGA